MPTKHPAGPFPGTHPWSPQIPNLTGLSRQDIFTAGAPGEISALPLLPTLSGWRACLMPGNLPEGLACTNLACH